MEKEMNSIPKAKSNKKTLMIVAIVVLCAAVFCCLLIVVSIFIFRPFGNNKAFAPEPQIVPQAPTSTAVPSLPTEPTLSTEPTLVETPIFLDYGMDPLFGSISLQRGFTPDPHIVAAGAGGTIDTSALNLDCGFTTSAPTFAFSLSGGASEGFLRIFYATSDNTDTTLVVYTPNQEWICKDDSPYGSGMDPVIDIDYAASGKYAIWVGIKQSDTYGTGRLFITQSANTTP